VLALPPTQTIRRLDEELYRIIKTIYHLPQCTANGLLYSKCRDGGLGVPKLETIVVSASLKIGLKFLNNNEPVIKAIIQESKFEQRLENVAKIARIHWPIISIDEIERYKIRAKRNELTLWAHLTSQGKAGRSFEGD
jgi:hypothetical protein